MEVQISNSIRGGQPGSPVIGRVQMHLGRYLPGMRRAIQHVTLSIICKYRENEMGSVQGGDEIHCAVSPSMFEEFRARVSSKCACGYVFDGGSAHCMSHDGVSEPGRATLSEHGVVRQNDTSQALL